MGLLVHRGDPHAGLAATLGLKARHRRPRRLERDDVSPRRYHLTRQGKIERIAGYIEAEAPSLPLRTCQYDESAGNCSDCEKCYRTGIGLLLAGPDPNDHGYEFGPQTFAEIRTYFESGESYLNETARYHWGMLQDAAESKVSVDDADAAEFFGWLVAQDFEAYVDASERSWRHQWLQAAGRKTPTPVYGMLYPLYSRIAN